MNTQQTIAALCLGASVVTAWDSQAITPAVIPQTLNVTVDPQTIFHPWRDSPEESIEAGLSNLRLFYGSFAFNGSSYSLMSYGSVQLLTQEPIFDPTNFSVDVNFGVGADRYAIAVAGTYEIPDFFSGVTIGVRPGVLTPGTPWPFGDFEEDVYFSLLTSNGDVGQFPSELLSLGFTAEGSPNFNGQTGPLFSFSDATPGGSWSVNVSAVPEPATVGAGLSLGGLLGWMWISRRRKA